MADTCSHSPLNQALAAISHSLVQFAGECTPWSDGEDETAQAALQLFQVRQRLQSARIAELLIDRDWWVDVGSYPTRYTDLHFISLNNLFPRLIANQVEIVATIETAVADCGEDEAAATLLAEALAEERLTLDDLRVLSG